jgi:hypothetical protein
MHPSLNACMREVAVAVCLSILSFQQLRPSSHASHEILYGWPWLAMPNEVSSKRHGIEVEVVVFI